MSIMDCSEVLSELERFPERKFYGSASTEMIAQAQSTLGIRFPADYIDFLSKLGSGFASSEEFIGLGGPAHLNVVTVASRLREPSRLAVFPKELIPLRSDGFGNYDCINLSGSNDVDGTLVVLWVHDGGDHQDFEVIEHGYWEWFVNTLKMVKELDEE